MPSIDKIINLRNKARVDCGKVEPIDCKPLEAPCLFKINEDPCEKRNLAAM